MAFSTKIIRYGTKYTPSKKDVLQNGPALTVFESVSLYGSPVLPQMCAAPMISKFPSVTVIDGCCSSKSALLYWQKTMIDEHGMEGFQRATAGTRFHSSVEKLLKLKAAAELPSLEIILQESHPSVHGYMQSIYKFLLELPTVVEPIVLEERVVHHELYYTGRFDAVLRIGDGLCLIDWKTASERSAVSSNLNKGSGLKGLYGYPRQLAAYVGAFNNDPTFAHLGKISKGMIVMAFDSGAPAQIIEMASEDLESNWKDYVSDVRKFWQSVQEGRTNFICYE